MPKLTYTDYNSLVTTPHRVDAYLAIVSVREPKHLWMPTPFTWTFVSGNTWKTDYPLLPNEVWHVWDVFNDGVELTPDTLTAGELDTSNTWHYDLATERAVYVNLGGDDPNDAKIQIGTLWAFCTDIAKNKRFTVFDIPTAFKNITATNVIFDRSIVKEGLGDIKFVLSESAYFGSALPDFSSLTLANVKGSILDQAGRFYAVKDRFQMVDGKCLIFGGDSGEVFDSLSDFRFFGEFRITNANLNALKLELKLASPFSHFQKMVPPNFYTTDAKDFEEDVKGKYKPLFWAASVRMPTNRLSENEFGFADELLSPQDTDVDVIVYNVASIVDPADYVATDGLITFDTAPADDAVIEVRAKRCWDINGDPADEQYAGAWLRQFLIQIVGIPESMVPATSFSDFDTNFPLPLIVYLEKGFGQITCQDVINRFLRSTFSVLTFENGIFKLNGFDIDNPPASVATVYEDEILTDPEIEQDTKEINACLTMLYGHKPNDDLYRQVTRTLNTAPLQYKNTDVPLIIEEASFLKTETDALNILVKYMCRLAIEKDFTKFHATGEVVKAYPGQIITVNKAIAPNSFLVWNSQEFKIRDIDLNTSRRPETTAELILEDVVTAEMRDYIIANMEDLPSTGSSNIAIVRHDSDTFQDTNTQTITINNDATNPCIVVTVEYSMLTDTDPTVTWNGNAPDSAITNVSSSNVRTAIFAWFGANASAGNLNAVITFGANVAVCYWTVIVLSGVASTGDEDAVYSAGNDLELNLNLTTVAGDYVVTSYVCERAPTLAQHTVLASQVIISNSRIEYDSLGYADLDSIHAVGTYRIAEGTSTHVRHKESVNVKKKCMTAMVLQPV